MAQILVRDLDDNIVRRLKKRAKDDGRSLQSEVKHILEQAAREPILSMEAARRVGKEFRAKFRGRGMPDTVKLLREDRARR